MNNIDEYQKEISKTDVSDHELDFYLAGMVEEMGEIAGIIKRIRRGDYNEYELSEYTIKVQDRLVEELGDLSWYKENFTKKIGINSSFVLKTNLEKINRRQKEGKILGEGQR